MLFTFHIIHVSYYGIISPFMCASEYTADTSPLILHLNPLESIPQNYIYTLIIYVHSIAYHSVGIRFSLFSLY